MLSKRYTVVLADRTTGVVRRFTVRLRPIVIGFVSVVTLPMLIGTGAALKARYDVDHLYASNATLELENANYRAATEQLAGQIMALQTAMSDLGTKAALDPSLQNSMDKLPAVGPPMARLLTIAGNLSIDFCSDGSSAAFGTRSEIAAFSAMICPASCSVAAR